MGESASSSAAGILAAPSIMSEMILHNGAMALSPCCLLVYGPLAPGSGVVVGSGRKFFSSQKGTDAILAWSAAVLRV